MKFRMLSVLSILLALLIKSMDISAKDYFNLRIMAHAIPADSEMLLPVPLETEVDSIVFRLAQANTIKERFVGLNDIMTSEFQDYERLKTIASEEELNNLLLHESPVVKVYAHRALTVNAMNMNCEYELTLIEDTTCVDWLTEDMLVNTTVADLIQKEYFE